MDEGQPIILARQSDYAEGIVDKALRMFGQIRTPRYTFEGHWDEVANLIDPDQRNTFTYGSQNTPGEKRTDKQIDSNGQVALHRFGAIVDSLLTPRNMTWHGLEASDDYVMKDRQTRLWFEDTTRKLFKYRYAALANFTSQNQANFKNLGAYGNMYMFTDRLAGAKGIRYKSLAVGEVYIRENHQNIVNEYIRYFRYTAYQAAQKWGKENLPEAMQTSFAAGSELKHDFIEWVCEREDYDPERLDHKGMRYASYYVSITGKWLMKEGGYHSFPLGPGRYEVSPQESYGRGPAMMVLPALKTLNAEKRVFLKQGHRAADPVLLTMDDGLMDLSLRPGALNKGGWSADGHPLIGTLPTGDIQISKEMMQEEKSLIQDAFFVTLFQILTETPQMTATEVIERVNEKGMLLAPTIGRQQSEHYGVVIPRELDLLMQQRLLLPMPPRLKEAGGEFHIVYTSPMSRAMRAQEAAGFMRTLESVKELAQITQDPSLLDPFNFDVAIPGIADIQGVLPSWMATEEQIGQKRKNRAASMQRQQQIQALPAQAAMLKARAVAAKASAGQPAPAVAPNQLSELAPG